MPAPSRSGARASARRSRSERRDGAPSRSISWRASKAKAASWCGCATAGVVETRLDIFEPPRFFEAFLRGRAYTEAPDITARICGICPVAYQMSAVQALEAGLGVQVDGQLRALRRLLYCGEWIESHVLHVTMLHAPDFLGYPDAVRMARGPPRGGPSRPRSQKSRQRHRRPARRP